MPRACSSSTMPFGSGHAPSGGNSKSASAVRRAVGVHLVRARRGTRMNVVSSLHASMTTAPTGMSCVAVRVHLAHHARPACSTRCRSPTAGTPSRAAPRRGRPRRGTRRAPRSGCRRRTATSTAGSSPDPTSTSTTSSSGSVAPTSNQVRRRRAHVEAPAARRRRPRARTASAGRCARAPWRLYCSNTTASSRRPRWSRRVEPLAEPDDVLAAGERAGRTAPGATPRRRSSHRTLSVEHGRAATTSSSPPSVSHAGTESSYQRDVRVRPAASLLRNR